MLVKDLIEILKNLPQDAVVLTLNSGMEDDGERTTYDPCQVELTRDDIDHYERDNQVFIGSYN